MRLQGKQQLHGCGSNILKIFRRTLRAVWTQTCCLEGLRSKGHECLRSQTCCHESLKASVLELQALRQNDKFYKNLGASTAFFFVFIDLTLSPIQDNLASQVSAYSGTRNEVNFQTRDY